jgi:hypothetical protein
MRKLLAVAACAVSVWGFVACGSDSNGGTGTISSAVDACKEADKVLCDKIFKCYTAAELSAAKEIVGLNTADCVIKFDAGCTPDMKNCNAGQVFHADKAQACVDGYKTFTCDDIKRDPIVDPAACDQVCTAN